MHRNICRGASAGTQTCGGSSGQPSEFNGPGQPTDLDKSHQCYDEAYLAIKIPEVDDIDGEAEQKVEAIRQAKQKVGELKPIDEVGFAQNVLKYNPEWEHSPNG